MRLKSDVVSPIKPKHNVCFSDSPGPTFAPMESLKERRNRLGLTQQELAQRCGYHHSHISHLEAGRTDPGLDLFVKLTEELGLSAKRLLDMLKMRNRKPQAATVADFQKERERRKRR